jgi:hypothetical protein
MATVTERPAPRVLATASSQVRDPLQRLRGYIRRYVITEALTVLLISLAVCFWVGLFLDYGSFRLFGIDWVQDLPRWFRALLLGTGLLAVVFVVELGKTMRAQMHVPVTAQPLGEESILTTILRSRWLLASVAVPLVAVYFTLWVLLSLARDDGTVGSLVVGLLVCGLLGGFTALIVVKRLLYEFRDQALALVLERRFPEILGDRLITAVELGNPKEAAKYGYSAVMVEVTIHEAAERVGKLPLGQVFDWKRLFRQGWIALVLTVAAYLIVGLAFCAFSYGRKASVEDVSFLDGMDESWGEGRGLRGFAELNQVAGIWAERNILLDNERWLKRSLILPTRYIIHDANEQVVADADYPETNEIKVGKGSRSVEMFARAIEYAIADEAIRERWRAVTLKDLSEKNLVDVEIPVGLPEGLKPRNAEQGLTLDEVKIYLAESGSKSELAQSLQKVVDAVDARAQEDDMSRALRKLILPDQVTMRYWGRTKRGEVTLERQGGNAYRGRLEDPSEDLRFNLRAEDFISDDGQITVVPPPRVAELKSVTSAPAYLYYLTRNEKDDRPVLAGKRQVSNAAVVVVDAEEKPRVPLVAGSDVTLKARTDKVLKNRDSVWLGPQTSPALKNLPITVSKDLQGFEFSVSRLDSRVEVQFVFRDEDGAVGDQKLVLEATPDAEPEWVQFKPVVVREVGGRFMVTPEAVIPFLFSVSDDRGLAGLDYVISLREAPSESEGAARAVQGACVLGLLQTGPDKSLVPTLVRLSALLPHSETSVAGRFPVSDFQTRIDRMREVADQDQILENLTKPVDGEALRKRMIRSYILKDLDSLDPHLHTRSGHDADVADTVDRYPFKGFDVGQIKRKVDGIETGLKARTDEVQVRYEMLVAGEARDINVEKPGRGVRRSTQQYAFLIVSDTELLYQISLEEQRLFDELKKAYDELAKAKAEMSRLRFDIPSSPDGLGKDRNYLALSVRVEDVEKSLREGLRVTTKVHQDYDKILREMRTNRIHKGDKRDLVSRVKDNVVLPLGGVLQTNFPDAQASTGRLRRALDDGNLPDMDRLARSRAQAEQADQNLDVLLTQLREILVQMQGIVDINKIIAKLKEIEEREQANYQRLKAYKLKVEESLLPPGTFEPRKP